MRCVNCQQKGPPAYTLRTHVDGGDGDAQGEGEETAARTDGGEDATVDLPFCSVECLRHWT